MDRENSTGSYGKMYTARTKMASAADMAAYTRASITAPAGRTAGGKGEDSHAHCVL